MVFLPRGIDVDLDTGNVFLADDESHLIKKFTNVGGFINSWGGFGSGDGQLNFPSDVAVESSTHDVYLDERENYRIQKFTNEGAFIQTWEDEGSGDGQFAAPHSIDVDSNGKVFVADTFNHRI
jgi:DNA-binding beta-propeller fold protein YncE